MPFGTEMLLKEIHLEGKNIKDLNIRIVYKAMFIISQKMRTIENWLNYYTLYKEVQCSHQEKKQQHTNTMNFGLVLQRVLSPFQEAI